MNRLFYITMLILLPCSIYGQDVYDLKRCIEIGLQQNYDIRIIRNEQLISDNNTTLANAGYLPSVDLSAGYSGTLNNVEQKLSSGETNKNNGVNNQNLNAGINLSWTVFDGFKIQTNYSRLKELQQMGETNTRITIENFIADLSTEYYNYIQQNIRLNNLKYAVKLSKERLRIVEARYLIGSSSRLDYQQAKVDFNADSSKLIQQYEVLFTSRVQLNKLMSVSDVEQQVTLIDTVINYNPLLNREDIWTKTKSSNSLLKLTQHYRQLSELDLKNVLSQNYPYLKLNAGYGYAKNIYDTGSYDWQKTMGFNYGVTIGMNLFNGNRKRQKQNAKLEIENRRLESEQLELSIKTSLANMWMAYQNNMQLVNLEKENVETAYENYDIAIDRYKLGDLSGIELREAQNSLFAADERLVQAMYNTKLCEISLNQLSGQIISYTGY
ncbi:MAG: TolC family protein [Prevotella sp.]|nr:TolC family protein [Prevotella sp.]